jgi:3-hydroxybutyryl-CoA dehydrogenase
LKRRTEKTSALNTDKKIRESMKSNKDPKPKRALVYIIGESPMAEQYAEICAQHGFDIYISWNEQPQQKTKFRSSNIKISSSIPAQTSVAIELTNIDVSAKKKNIEKLSKALPDTAPILTTSITVTATEQASWILNKHRLVGMAALPTFIEKSLVEIAPTIYSPKETLEAVSHFFLAIGKNIEIVQDRVGMVLPRILCQLINEASFAVVEDIAAPQDIDKVLKLGLHFPLGPIEWAEQIGLKQVQSVLAALYSDLQEERYRISPLLRQMAVTNEWWKQTSTNG